MSRQGSFKEALFAMVADGSLSAAQALALVRKLETAVDRFDLDRDAADLLSVPTAGTGKGDPIAVIGMAGRFGDCPDLEAFWAMIEAGRSCVRPLPEGRWSDTDRVVWGGLLEPAMVSAFDPFFFRISPTEAALMDPQQRLFLEVAYEAFEDAAYGEALLAGRHCGVFVGAGAGDYSRLLDAAGAVASPLALMGNVASILAARIAYHLNLKGPAVALDTACSSSLVAVHLACESLRRGECDMVLAGGVCVINTGRFAAAMTEAGMLSPSGQCHSFDARADGFVCGEGAGAIVLKRLSDAQRDGDSIRGVILGSGTNQDGRTNGITAPSAPAQAELERAVYERFGIDPRAIGYVEAHGTGTPLGDPIEVEALTKSFGEVPAGCCPIGSVKTNLGHALTAAGIAGVIKLLLMLRAATIPGAPDFEEPNPRLALEETPFHVPTRASAWVQPESGPRTAVVSSFGFSGTNAHLVLAETSPGPAREPEGMGAHALLLAAKSESALQRLAGALARALGERPGLRLEDVAFSLACRATAFEHRAAVVAADRPTAIAGLGAIASGAMLPPVQDGSAAAAMAALWVEDGKVELERLKGRRVPLPTYPFERMPCLPPGMARVESAKPEKTRAPEATLSDVRASLLDAEPSALFAGHGEGFGRVEALGRRLAAAALFEAGLGGTDRRVHTRAGLARRFGVVAERMGLWDAVLDILAREGLIGLEGDVVRLGPEDHEPRPRLEQEAAVLAAAEPALAPFLDLLARTTAGLPQVLRGEVAGTTVLFPDGRLDLVEAIYAHNPLAEHFNALMARSVRALVADGVGAKSEILEVGAGTGGATGGILEALAGLEPRPAYLYSDLSLGFLQHGHERFGERIEPLILDVTRPGEPQGVATGSCAVIVASNVLHATPDLEATLGHLRRLLAPGGFLVLNEVTAVQDFATLTFGLTDGWWAFEDAAARLPGAPLLDVGRWREALARAGFSELTALGLPGQGDEAAMGQAVLVARRDERPVEPAAVGPRQSWPPAALPRAAASPAGDGRDLEAVLTEELASVLGVAPAAIDRRGRFMDYGVDSILGVGFVSRVNARFGLDLKPTIVFARPTVADLARHLSADLGVEAAKVSPAPVSGGAPVVAPVARAADEPIAVIGMAGRFASAGDLEAFAAMLAEGRSGIGDLSARFDLDLDNPPEHLRSAAPYLRSAGALPRIDLFDPLFFRISGREAELTDPQHRIFVTEAWRALEDAGYGDLALDGADCGVFVGCHGGDYTHRMAELGIVPDSNAFTGNAASVLAGRIAYVLNLRGPAIAVDTACSSSLVAVHLACQSLRTGECRMALAGGVFLSTTLGFNVAAASAGMLSPRGRCATFDAEADGFVPGEGAGAVLLKPLSQALADGDHVIATIIGSAVNQDGRTSGITAPSPLSQAEVIRRAQGHAGVRPNEVSYVETHGTGTRLGDPIEVEGLTRAFAAEGTAPHRCALGSVKTNVGHAAHAAGIAGLLKTLLSFEKGVLYPSLHFRTENPVLELSKTPFFVQTELTPWDRPADGRRVAGVSSFGFSGTNCHLVLADAPVAVERRAAPPAAVLATLSAPTRTALAQRARDLAAWLGRHGKARLDDVAFTLGAGRSHFRERMAIIARSGDELRAHLEAGPEAGSLAGDRQVDARLAEAGQLYLDGGELDFRALFPEARRLSLPTYPFEETSYWLTPPEQPAAASSKPAAAAQVTLPSLQAPAWVPVQPTEKRRGRRVLVIGGVDDDGLVEALRAAGHQASRAEGVAGPGAVDAEAVLVRTRGGSGAATLAPLFALVGELVGRAGGPVTVIHLHDGEPVGAGAAAFAPSLVFLGSPVRFHSVGLEPGADAGVVARSIGQVLDGDASDLLLGRDGRLRQRVLAPVAVPAKPAGRDFGGVWLVTGGLGGLGRRFAAHLARTRGARIAIVGQGALDAGRRAQLDGLRAAGAEVAYAQADVGDRDQLTKAVAELEHALGPVTAVLHAAGRPGGAVIGQKGWREIEPVLRAKIDGALALDAILADRPLKAFVLFSSLAAEHGDFGQCDYAVANAALVRFAEWRAEEVRRGRRHGRTLALSWPIWSGGHAALSSEGQALFSQALGMPFLEPEAGIATFEAGLAAADAPASLVVTTGAAEPRVAPVEMTKAVPGPADERRAATMPASRAAIERRLIEMVARQQKIDPARVRPEEGLANFGFDSIGLKELAVGLSSAFGVEITPAVFFAHGSIGALAAHLIEEHGDALAMGGMESPAVPAEPAPVARAKAAPAGEDAGAVAIIGMAGRFPGAADLGGLRALVEAGRQSVGAMPEARRRLLGLEREADPLTAGYVDGIELFDHQLFRISRRDAVHMDPQHRLAIEAVWQALEDAAIAPVGTAGKAVGVFFGQQVNGYAGLIETEEGARSQLALGNIASMLPGRISFALDWHGPAEAIDTACSSGLVAVHHAVRALRDGECELAVAGAVSLILDPEDVRTTGQLGVLSPDGRCHSFDARANGYVKGEGVGVVVLKPLARALADGDPIHAVIRGSAVNHGGRAHSLTAPNAQAQRRLVETALADAGLPAAAIGLIEAHGTGTELGDPVEVEALAGAFGEGGGPGSCAIGTVKANIGHLEPAAGIAGLLKAVLAVEHGVRPALAGFETLNPYIRLDGTPFYIPTAAEPWRGAGRRRAGISSFGFTGTNAHVVIEEPPASVDTRAPAEEPVLLMLSAADGAQLSATVGALARRLEAEPGLDLRDVALTLMLGRNAMPQRAAALARPGAFVVATLDALAAHLDEQGAAPAECWIGGGDGKAALLTDDPEDQDYLLSLCRRNRLDRVARLWCAGASPEPRLLAEAMPWARTARRIALPGLAMRRSVCWGTLRQAGPSTGAAASVVAHVERPAPVAPVVAPVASEPMPLAAPQPAYSGPQAAEVLTKLRALIAQALYLTPDDIDDTAGFMDLGLDSILAVEVAKSINDTFGTDLQATRLFDHPNVAALAGHLVERLSEGEEPQAAAVDERVVEEVADFVRSRLALALGIDAAEVAADQPLDSLGVSPEIAAGALDALNRRFGVALDLGELARCRDLRAVFVMVAGRIGKAPAEPETVQPVVVAPVVPARPAPAATAPAAMPLVARELADLLFVEPDALDPDLPLAELGLDIVLATELADRLVYHFGEDAPGPRAILTAPGLRQLAESLGRPPAAEAPPEPKPVAALPVPAATRDNEQKIAVVGMACRYPGAPDKDAFWRLLVEGRSGIGQVPAWRWRQEEAEARLQTPEQRSAVRWGGFVDGIDRFDPLFFNLSPRDAVLMDPQQRLFLEEAWHAFEDAGLTREQLRGSRCGVFIGVGQGDYSRLLREDDDRLTGQLLLGNTCSILTSRISYLLDLKGPSVALDTACSSSLVAADMGVRAIREGRCDTALVGGINLMTTPQMLVMTAASGMLAPDGQCKTFDDRADGFVAGEGIGLLVLKRLDQARRDGDRVYGIVRASGTNQDGKTSGITAPNAKSQEALEVEVWEGGGIDPAGLGLIEAHGTGTRLGDPIEIDALSRAFKRVASRPSRCAIGSVKTNIGHTLAAAGAAGLIKTLLALHHRTIPPSIHYERPNRHIDFEATPFRVATAAEPWRERRLAAVSSFGFSGTNAHLVIEGVEAPPAAAPVSAGPQLLLVSARDEEGLARQAANLAAGLAQDRPRLEDVAYTLGCRRTHHEWRAAIVAGSLDEALAALGAVAEGQAHPSVMGPRKVLRASEVTPAGSGLRGAAESWAAGGPVPEVLFGEGRFVDLPLTAFAGLRCWPERLERAAAGAAGYVALAAEDPVMANHRVQGVPVLPGMAALAMLAAAARKEGFEGPLEEIAWIRPVAAPAAVRVTSVVRGDRLALRLVDREERVCARATARREPVAAPPDLDGALLGGMGGASIAPDAVRAFLEEAGIEHGGAFRLLTGIERREGCLLARLAPGQSEAWAPVKSGPVSPAALDSALQALAAHALGLGSDVAGDGRPFLPAGVGRFVCHRPMEGELVARIEVDPAATDDARLTADLLIVRPGGEVVAELRGFVARRLERALDAQDAGGVVYLRPFWEPKPVPALAGQPPLVLHTPGAGAWAAAMARETGGRALAAEALDPARLSAVLGDGAASVVFAAWDEVPRQALELAGPELALVERDAVGPMHALLQAIARSGAACRLTLVTRGLAAVPGETAMAPAYAALPGLVLTAGRELAKVEATHVDLPLAASEEEERAHRSWILGEAGGGAVVAYRGPQRLLRALETVVLDEGTNEDALEGLPERAACLIVGGAGGLGRALSLHLAQKLRARIAWIGRRAEDERIRSAREAVEAAGGEVFYRQLDAADEAGLRGVVAELRQRWGGIGLAVHSALVLADRSLAQMTPAELDAALRPKTHGLVALARALADGPQPRLCAFSSANAFTLNPGQANYAAGSTFADAYVLALARSAGWRATILNWGIWGETGIVAQESFIERARREGVLPLSTAEGMRAFELALARSLDQAMVLKVAPERRASFEGAQAARASRVDAEAVLDMAGGAAALAEGHVGAEAADMAEAATGMTALVRHARHELARVYEGLGLWGAAPDGIEAMADRLGVAPARRRLLEAHLEILARAGWVRLEPGPDGAIVHPLAESREEPASEVALPPGPLALLEAAIGGTADLLRGRREATDILFPGGSAHLVDAVYAGDRAVDFFNGLVAAAVRGLATDRPLRVLEIGAGTGATTRRVLEALGEGQLESYHVTDISPRLVAQAREAFGRYPAARFATFDVTRDPGEAGLEEGGFDVVLAANVLHATPHLAVTLRNAKRLLRRGGALILNEATAVSDFATLTFGLTDGWWAFEDFWLRLPHAPLLSVEGWQALLSVEGFSAIAAGGLEGGGQHVILAESDGWLRRAGQVAAATAEPATRPSAPSVAASQGVASALDIAREALAETLKLEPHRIDAEAPLERYGVDSLVAGELQARLEEIYGSLPRTLVFEARSLAELATALSTRTVQRPVASAQVSAPAPAPAAPVQDDAIAIIGIAGRYPGAETIEALWDNLEKGRSAITDAPADRAAFRALRAEEAALGRGGFLADVAGFDPLLFGISPAEAATMDPQERLFLETVWAGLENAGRLPEAWEREVGVFVGVMGTDYGRLAAEEAARGGPGLGSSAFWSIANRVSHVFDLTGPSLAVDTACSASLAAIHLAAESLRRGECRAAIAGGVHLILHPASRRGLLALGLQSPTGEARAFAEDADGLVGGEGVGCLVLRRLEDAVRDGDRILGVVRATHMAANGRGRAYMAPNAGGQAKALARLLERAAIAPGSIGYVESQATGSPLADLFDITGLARTVGGAGRAGPLPVGTLKPALGHLEAASGVAQVTKVLGMLERGLLMPTPGVGALHPDIAAAAGAALTVCRARAPWPRRDGGPPRRALVESFGAGGATAFAIIEEWQGGEAAPLSSEAPYVVPLSARTATALRSLAQALLEHLRTGDGDLAALAWTLQTGRATLDHRLACVAGSVQELEEMLEAWLDGEPGGWHEGVRATNGGVPTEPAGAGLDELAAFWVAGGTLDWASRWQGPRPSPVALPTYPFEHRPYWLSGVPAAAVPTAVGTRRAVVLDGPADIDALVVREVPLGPPGEGEVQIRVRAFALNFADLLSVRGLYPNLDRYPFLPGFEVAGEVVAVGPGVQRLAVGDAVMALAGGHGGQADHVNLPEAVVALKPEGMGWAEAAASPIGYLTMRLALDRADLQPGETVLIQSAAGGTGPFAVQMAIERGARVIATAGSRAKLDMLRRLGVEHGIDYLAEDFAARVREVTGGRGVDVVLNTIGGEAIQKGVDLLAPGGRYVEIAVGGLASAGPIDLSRLTANQSIISVNLGRLLANAAAARRALDAMTKDLGAGRIRPIIAEIFPFNRLDEAYRQIDERRNIGKVVVSVDEGELPAAVEAPARVAPARPAALAAGSIGPGVAAIVREILALDDENLDPDRPLQELGLSSVSGLAIMRAVQERLGIAAPTTALWQHGSVRALTGYLESLGDAPAAALQDAAALLLLRERGEGQAHDPLVPIETRGTKPPSFWVHGAPGEVSWVVRLSEALGPDYPVFGLEAQGVGDGAPPQRSIARMARRYVEAMRRQQPEGPYRLGGYSGGGVIAFEMVRQLQAAGQKVERLVLLDAWAPGNPALAGMEEVYGPSFVFLLAVNWLGSRWGMAVPLQPEALAGLGREAALERALDHLYGQVTPAIERPRVRAVLDGMERVGRAIGRALSRYEAEPLEQPVGEVLMIRCAQNMSPEGNPLALPTFLAEADYRAGWEALLGRAMLEVEVRCDHFNLLADPFREEVASAIIALDAPSAASKANGQKEDRLLRVVEEQIRAVLPDLPPDAIRPGVTLTELGATSMDRAEVASGSMEALGIVVPLGELAAVADVNGLIEVLARHLPKLNGSGGHGHEVEGAALRGRA